MLALIGNLDFSEIMIVLFVAILIFGKNLPKVAGQAGAQIAKLRRQLDQMWRETGMDREIRDVQRNIQDIRNVVPRDMSVGEMARIASKEIEKRLAVNEQLPAEEGAKTIDVNAQVVEPASAAPAPDAPSLASAPTATNSHPPPGEAPPGEAPLYGPSSDAATRDEGVTVRAAGRATDDPGGGTRSTEAATRDNGVPSPAAEPAPSKLPAE